MATAAATALQIKLSSCAKWSSTSLEVEAKVNMKPPLVMDPNELITTKRIINHRTKQIETRVQRQIVIEDGKVVSDTGPLVTTKTLEDSKEEVDEQVEHKYAYCPHYHHHQWPTTVKQEEQADHQTQTPVVEANSSKPLKTFVFGGDERKAQETAEEPETKPQQNRPSKTFYFGQKNITDEKEDDDCNDGDKEKENMQVKYRNRSIQNRSEG